MSDWTICFAGQFIAFQRRDALIFSITCTRLQRSRTDPPHLVAGSVNHQERSSLLPGGATVLDPVTVIDRWKIIALYWVASLGYHNTTFLTEL